MTDVIVDNVYPIAIAEAGNDYLDGLFAPIGTEITATDLPVIGTVPDDIDGVLVRNGHNPLFSPPSGRYHWFDGDAMLHAAHFSGGTVTYRNRMVLTAGLLHELERGEGVYPGLRDGFRAEEAGLKNNSGTDVILHNGELKTLFSRCGQPYRVDPYSLTTLGPESFGGAWTAGCSAHSKVDEATGELIWFHYSFNTLPYMSYGVVDADNRMIHQTEITLPGPRMPHDCWITQNHTILHDFPLIWEPEKLAAGQKTLIVDPALRTRFGVIPRFGHDVDVRWFEFEPTYMLHSVNAWEEGDEIVAYGFPQTTPIPDIPRGTKSVKAQNYFLSFQYSQPRLKEYRMNLRDGTASERFVDDQCVEMPCINTRFLGRRNRWAWNTFAAADPLFLMDGIQLWDFERMEQADSYRLPEGHYLGQLVFAPRRGATAEDDGYVLSFVASAEESAIWIWDARRIGAGPLCRIGVPQRVPGGSHAFWARTEDIERARARKSDRWVAHTANAAPGD